MKKAVVKAIKSGSIAEELSIECGDIIKSVNGNEIEDELDFRFYTVDDFVEIQVEKKNGEQVVFEIEKEDESLGIEFEDALFGSAKSCRNKCIFCFIDQLPRGMRESLYFKDDDARLSFLTGNYITLTNLSQKDVEKIIKMRLEPINISVHTTNPSLRCEMLRNKFAGDALSVISKLYEGKIHMNGQIVLVKGVNDGRELDKTIEDLSKLYPYMTSVSVVPVGITKHREGLYPLSPLSSDECREVICKVHGWQEKLLGTIGTRFIYASDEFYLKAGHPLPQEEEYEGYYQIENGVGLIRSLTEEFYSAMDEIKPCKEKTVNIVTGEAAYDTIEMLCRAAHEKYPCITVKVHKIINNFFGENITVAGLLTGQDIACQLKGKLGAGDVLIPEVMLRSGTDVFLDDMRICDVEREIGATIRTTKCDGYDLWKKITE